MNEIRPPVISEVFERLLKRQAQWQKERKSLSWPEKIHMAEAIRNSVLQIRRTAPPAKSRGMPPQSISKSP